MFTNLTKPEGRRKGKGTSEGKGAEKKREMSGEKSGRERQGKEALIKPLAAQGYLA